jgi:hypothetical protein
MPTQMKDNDFPSPPHAAAIEPFHRRMFFKELILPRDLRFISSKSSPPVCGNSVLMLTAESKGMQAEGEMEVKQRLMI